MNACLFVVMLFLAPPTVSQIWDFDADPPGKIARGFRAIEGDWKVVDLPEGGRALAQTATNPDKTFNVALVEGIQARDVDLSVRLFAVEGVDDQGGGVVWRARDGRNYYIARFNPLEDNFRVYHVVNGVRTQLQSADVKRTPGWHALRVRHVGDHISCALDGKELLDVKDRTFSEAGMIGLWSKADARSRFDELTLRSP